MSTFIRYNSGDIVTDNANVHSNTWSTGNSALTSFFTSSHQQGGIANYASPTSSGQFFLDVYATEIQDGDAPSATSASEFSIAYGHKAGSGSRDFTAGTGGTGFNASKAVYNQYRQLVYGNSNREFTFQGVTPDDIYVINFERARIKQGLKPGSLNLTLKSGSSNFVYLTDDSVTSTGSAVLTNLGRQFNLVTGSSGVMLGTDLTSQTVSGSFGFVYPDSGIIIFNPKALGTVLGDENLGSHHNINDIIPNPTSGSDGLNPAKLYLAIAGGNSFIVDSEETISSQYYFTRVTNQEFNYSSNPSFSTNNGDILYDSMVNNPRVYITTVGLYNDNQELLAVAKLSKPLAKDFTKESLIRIKLDY
tara:strand:+ start:560 stop:1645 length:1086 start_codon:yes stop_codon:yes gene_type:complete